MPATKCLAEVIEVKRLTHDVKEIAFKLIQPDHLNFKAGQYIAIEVTEMKDGRPRQNNRPYSIVSPPEEREVIRLCVNLVNSGPGSSYLHKLKVGEQVSFLQPFGYFVLKTEVPAPILFVATGTGIAPILSMIVHLIHINRQQEILLYWGLRSERDLYYQDLLAALAEKDPLFRFETTLSQPSAAWQGARGRVTEKIAKAFEAGENQEAYLCGSLAMIREVRTMLMEKGLPKSAIHFEKFF